MAADGITPLVILGNLTLPVGGTVTVTLGAPGPAAIQVQGATQISLGNTSLNLVLTQPASSDLIPLIQSALPLNGSFSTVTVTANYPGAPCDSVSGQQVVEPHSLSVLVSSDCSGGLGTAKIAGIVVGSVALIVWVSRYLLRKAWTDTFFRPDVSYQIMEQDDGSM